MISILATAALLLAPTPSETTYLVSIEWLTSESSLIFIGAPIERGTFRSASGHWIARERFQLDEVLKGPPSDGDTLTVFTMLAEQPGKEWFDDHRPRLQFCKVSRQFVKEIEGRYTCAATGPHQSSFLVGEPAGRSAGDTSQPPRLDTYFTPELQPIRLYEEVEGRTRRHVAWEDHVRRGTGRLDIVQIMREPRPSKSSAGVGAILPFTLLQDGYSHGVQWPQLRGREGEPLLRWPEERNRPAARIEVSDDDIEFVTVRNSQHAFSNRRYAWVSVPDHLFGWRSSLNEGGAARPIHARVTVSGHVFLAVEQKQVPVLAADGWTPAAWEGDLDLIYSDRGSTKLTVLSRYFPAGATVTFPAVGWTGAIVLLPPAWL